MLNDNKWGLQMPEHSLWQSVLGELELLVPDATYKTWFTNTELLNSDPENVTIAVSNVFAITQFQKRYDEQVRAVLKKNGCNAKKVSYVVNTKHKTAVISRETTSDNPRNQTSSTTSSTHSSLSRDLISGGDTSNINSRYTFDNFIVGSSNDMAYTACQAVAANPGSKYNPVFIYGGVGLGKTHLIQAVGNEILKRDPKSRVLYTTTETFVKEFLDNIRYKKKGFSDRYRNVDVLIIDDIQFIANKQATQEEFFHTFNALHQANKQIIISSDKPPKSIPTLTERLKSRFEWGMTIDIQMPDFETRCAIIETKSSLSGVELNRETIEYLATNVKTNIRELEGALNQLLAYSEMRGIEPDISTAEGLIGNIRHSRPQHLTAKQIIERTAKHFDLTPGEICSAKRDKHIVVPRQIAMYLLRSELHLSFPKVANELGRKDHTTAIHSIEKIDKAIKLDLIIREHVAEIKERLYA